MGRSKDEYVRIVALAPGDLLGKIPDCTASPSSLNAELTAEGHEGASCDPSHSLTIEEIHARILATHARMVPNVRPGESASGGSSSHPSIWARYVRRRCNDSLRTFLKDSRRDAFGLLDVCCVVRDKTELS